MSERIMLADIDVYDDQANGGAGGEVTLRFSTGRGYFHPQADGPYLPVIAQPLSMRRAIFDGARSFGVSRVGYGEMTLVNVDGQLNSLFEHGYGRDATFRIGDPESAPNAFTTFFTGQVRQPAGNESISLRLRDRQAVLDVPLQPERFDGTSTGPTGLEGRPEDMEGKVKPRLFGVCLNVSPVLANASTEVWAVNFDRTGNPAPVASIDAVYAQGADYVFGGTDHADHIALMTASITAGTYHTCLAEGLIRTSGGVFGQLTCDVTEGATASDRTAIGIVSRILGEIPELLPVDVNDVELGALDTLAPYTAGIYADQEATVIEILDQLFSAIGGWFGPDRLGVFRFGRIEAPAGSPVRTLKRLGRDVVGRVGTDIPLISVRRVAAGEDGAGLPVQNLSLGYARNWTVQNSDALAGSVSDARRSELAEEYRKLNVVNSAVTTKYPNAPELGFDTVLVNQADAQTELTRRNTLFGIRRDFFSARVRLDDQSVQAMDVGAIVEVITPDFGLQAGRLFLVVEVTDDALNNIVDLTLWG